MAHDGRDQGGAIHLHWPKIDRSVTAAADAIDQPLVGRVTSRLLSSRHAALHGDSYGRFVYYINLNIPRTSRNVPISC